MPRPLHTTLVIVSLFAVIGSGCEDKKTTEAAPDSATQKDKAKQAARGSEKAESAPAEHEKAETEKEEVEVKGEAPDRAVLEEALESLDARAGSTLTDDPACKGFSDLNKCREDERESEFRTAAECYRNYVVVGGPDQCRAAQFVRAATNFERANKREAAVDARMQAVESTETPTAASVDAADFMLEHGEVERARGLYAEYLDAHEESPLVDYVKAQCERIGGCVDEEKAAE